MNILIIGNGFDIAHQLPTRYKDFLNLCLIATKVRVTWINEHASVSFISIDEYKEKDAEYFKIIKEVVSFLRCDLWEEFEKIVESNFWTYYFLERKEVIGEKWINLEDEIKSLLESIYDDKRKSNDGTIKQFQIEIFLSMIGKGTVLLSLCWKNMRIWQESHSQKS